MSERMPTPAQTARKARMTALATSILSLVMISMGWMPAAEDLVRGELLDIIKNLAELIALVAVPTASAYLTRNHLK